MDYLLLVHPLVGAVIGYVTNWIAVKMLFKPTKAIYIGKFQLPFTPGIIPKNQARLAHGISSTIATSLLNEDVLKETLLSDEILDQINSYVETYLNTPATEPISLNDIIQKNASTFEYNNTLTTVVNNITTSILTTIKEANLAAILSQEIEDVINENMQKNLITRIARKPIVSKLSDKLEPEINKYIDENGHDLIKSMVEKEITKYLNTSNIDLQEFIKKSDIDVNSIIKSRYTSVISTKLTTILDTINITKIIETRINSMEPDEIERLVLSIINKELNALVNLGAVIGFVLGLTNMFI